MKSVALMIGSVAITSGQIHTIEKGESCYQQVARCAPGLCCVHVSDKLQEDEEKFTLCHPGGDTEWCDDTFDENSEEKKECDWGYAVKVLQCTPLDEGSIKTSLSYLTAALALSYTLA